jgi:hypothetical protein
MGYSTLLESVTLESKTLLLYKVQHIPTTTQSITYEASALHDGRCQVSPDGS